MSVRGTELRERKGRSGMARISKTKIDALKLVEAGRIEYGAEYPNLARRSGSNALDASFLVDGSGVYGGQHSTFAALDSTGMIEVRYDLADTDDPGWRTRVELTAAGREALAASGVR